MKVVTKAYGTIDVSEKQKILFPSGLFGFESLKDYVMLDAEQQPFFWLQSAESAAVAFIMISPFLWRPDYELNLVDEELSDIGLSSPEAALVFSIVTIPPDGEPMTANLQGPIVINRDTRLGKQLILNDPRWKTKHDIMDELSQNAGGGTAKKVLC
ncbi:MAG: flagellar assembly protein FliW [Spirochaetaceae bacterium]|jgi:flagellar assembly factor FliW|nr:flagellar assembly protein FliW [Spirochaetaceae bacterium]